MSEGRARRMAEATRSPIFDRPSELDDARPLEAGGLVVPRRGAADLDVDGHVIHLTHLERVLWPEAGFTKGDLVAYMLDVAPVLLPHLVDAPLTVGRFPGGVDGRGFAQTEIPGRPEFVRYVPIPLAKGPVKRFTVIDDRAGLVWLAQMGVLEIHAFLGRWPHLERPRAIVLDLDPTPPAGVLAAAEAALALRRALGDRASYVKTSGSLGLHVLVPTRASSFAETRAEATRIAAGVAEQRPDLVSLDMKRAGREGKVLIDTRQNSERLTMVVPWSLRTTPLPRVSMPLEWSELEAARDDGALTFDADAARARALRPDPLAPLA